jgi:hypothetical protein
MTSTLASSPLTPSSNTLMTTTDALVPSEPSMTHQDPSFSANVHSAHSRENTRDFPFGDPGHHSVPYAGQTRMQLTIASGVAEAHVRIDPNATELISVTAEGVETQLRVSPTEVRVSWPKTFATWLRSMLDGMYPAIEIVLHPAVEWSLAVRGGVSRFDANLAAGKLAGIEIRGGMSDAHFDLPAPTAPVPVRVFGGVSELRLRRPADTGVSLAISGGVSTLHLDEQQFGSIGGGSRLVSGAVHGDAPRYAVEIKGGASGVCVTSH